MLKYLEKHGVMSATYSEMHKKIKWVGGKQKK